ncbi:MAG: hypothetical protein ACOC85_05745 [Thermoplasmatota archaeon]
MDGKNRLLISTKRVLGKISFLRKNHRKVLKGYLNLKEAIVGIPSSTKVMEREWDFLIVLDACRYDMFKENNFIEGDLKKINSTGSSTTKWIKNNFDGKYKDTVVVSSNPHLSQLRLKKIIGHNPFFHIENVWDYGWDEDLNTVPPHAVNEGAKKIIDQYKDKRIIIHYMQPHYPFIGEHQIIHSGVDSLRKEGLGDGKERNKERNPWDDLAEGEIDLDEFMKAYNSNLKLVLKYVQKLLPHLNGKVIITSDHGNCIGEMGLHGHPGGFNIKPLIEVPWFQVKNK